MQGSRRLPARGLLVYNLSYHSCRACVRDVLCCTAVREKSGVKDCILLLSLSPVPVARGYPFSLPFTVLLSFSWLYEFLELIAQVPY